MHKPYKHQFLNQKEKLFGKRWKNFLIPFHSEKKKMREPCKIVLPIESVGEIPRNENANESCVEQYIPVAFIWSLD